MKILAISDLHGEMDRLDDVERLLKEERPDLVIFAGDIVKGKKRGDEWLAAKREGRNPNRNLEGLAQEIEQDTKTIEAFLDRFAGFEVPLAYVPGNMDSPKEHFLFSALAAENAHKNVHCVHGGAWVFREKYVLSGYGGDISADEYEDVFQFLSPRWEVEYHLKFLREFDQMPFMVFHLPPASLIGDSAPKSPGYDVVEEMIQTYRPELVIVGHQHDLQKRVEVGKSLVVSPGALKKGKYALIDWPKGDVTFGSF